MAFGNQTNDKTALVIGATGGVGMQLIFALVDKNYHITATYHKPEDKDTLVAGRPLHLDLVSASTQDLQQEVCKHSVVFFCAGSGGKDVWNVDRDGAIKVANAISSCHPDQRPYFVLLSTMGADQPENMPDSLRDYGQAKKQADDQVFGLQTNGLRFTIVRPGPLTDDRATGKVVLQETVNKFKRDSLLHQYKDLEIPREDVAKVMLNAFEVFGRSGASHIIEVMGGDKVNDKATNIYEGLAVLVN